MKERITVTLDKELLSWLDSKVNSRVFANRSHGFEFLIFEEKGSKEKTDQEHEDQ
mgnify:FL=1